MIERKAKVTVNEWITHGNDAFLLTGARQIGRKRISIYRI